MINNEESSTAQYTRRRGYSAVLISINGVGLIQVESTSEVQSYVQGTMAGQAQNNTVVDVNFQRYCNCMYVVCQRAMCRVFLYLYQHHQQNPSLYVREVLAGIPGVRLGARQKQTLVQRESPVRMDITLLYILLQQTCGLQPDADQDSVWKNPTTQAQIQSLEHKLYQIKELRNDLSHEPGTYMRLTNQQLKEKVEHLEHLCCDVVREAADRTGLSSDSINTVTTGISADLQLILTSTHSNDFHPQEWATLAREEQRTNLTHHQLPSAELLYKTPQKDWVTGSPENVLSFLETLLPQLILLTGQAGAGKTTLCQQAWESWVGGGSGDSECDLVLRVPCEVVDNRDVARIVKEKLLPNTCQTCDYSQVLELLGSLRVMWLLDGMEDAGPEALHLLRGIISKFSEKHVILVTCQPKYAQEFINVTENGAASEIQLDGLSIKGAQTLAKHMLKDEEYLKFTNDVANLGNEVINELRNPLKLKLAVTLWQEGILSIEPGVSLPHLYAVVEAVLIGKVAERLSKKWPISIDEAKSRVHTWLKELYKVAFEMTTQNRFIVLDKSARDSLEENLQLLLPSYTDCFSTFLTCLPNMSSSEGCYRFIHLTQQRYLAAQHLCQLLLSNPNPAEAFTQALQLDHADANKLHQLYNIALQVLSSLTVQNKLNEKHEEILINTLAQYEKTDWLEVVRCSGHSESVAKRASQHIPDIWTVTDNYLHAATIILKHTRLSYLNNLILSIRGIPSTLCYLMPFLEQVAISKVQVTLHFLWCRNVNGQKNYCDEYLKVLCNPVATCVVIEFFGSLTADGCLVLSKERMIQRLWINIPNMKTLEAVLFVTRSVPTLQVLHMNLITVDINTSLRLHARKGVIIDLNLPHATDARMSLLTRFIRNMSQEYRTIKLYHVSAKGALQLVKKLTSNGTTVSNLSRMVDLTLQKFGQIRNVCIPYGSIPTHFSDSEFKGLWKSYLLSVAIEMTTPAQNTANERT